MLSVRPEHADKIFSGVKTVELRRLCPKLAKGDLVLVYVSSPIKSLVGGFRVDKVLAERPQSLWAKVQFQSGLTREEFDLYYLGARIGYGIVISEAWRLPKPLSLYHLKALWPGFRPPQSYCYLVPGKAGAQPVLECVARSLAAGGWDVDEVKLWASLLPNARTQVLKSAGV